MHFNDFKGTAWGHGQVIGTSSHSIFYVSCVEREPGIVACCYAKYTLCKGCAWNYSCSGQEKAMLCIIKLLKENRKLVFQMRNRLCSTTMSRTKLKQQENTWICIQEPSMPDQKESLS